MSHYKLSFKGLERKNIKNKNMWETLKKKNSGGVRKVAVWGQTGCGSIINFVSVPRQNI